MRGELGRDALKSHGTMRRCGKNKCNRRPNGAPQGYRNEEDEKTGGRKRRRTWGSLKEKGGRNKRSTRATGRNEKRR